MKIIYLGHASLLIETQGKRLVVDPFITANELAKVKVDLDSLQPDYILVTHAHQDHTLDVDALAASTKATIISNYEIVTHYENKGFTGHPMNHGGSWTFDFGNLQYVNAIHTSSFADGTYGGQPGGFILTSGGKTVYIAGDTALTQDMKLIPLRHQLDLAILPIGDNFTMGPEDAVIAADFVACDQVMGYHYDTFGYIKIDADKAKAAFSEGGKTLLLPVIGETITI